MSCLLRAACREAPHVRSVLKCQLTSSLPGWLQCSSVPAVTSNVISLYSAPGLEENASFGPAQTSPGRSRGPAPGAAPGPARLAQQLCTSLLRSQFPTFSRVGRRRRAGSVSVRPCRTLSSPRWEEGDNPGGSFPFSDRFLALAYSSNSVSFYRRS